MATVYIDPTGTYNGDGTSQAPATVGGGVGAKNTYVGLTWTSGNSYLQKSGTKYTGQVTIAASNVTMSSYGIGAKPIIDANNANNFCVYHTGKNAVIIDGFEFRNSTSTSGVVIPDGSSTGNIIRNCLFNGMPKRGILLGASQTGAIIDNNVFVSSVTPSEGVFSSAATSTISNNTFTNTYTPKGSGIFGIRVVSTTGGDIYGNTIGSSTSDSAFYGVSLESVTGASVHQNTIIGCWNGLVYPSGDGYGIQLTLASAGNKVYKNIISTCNRGYLDSSSSGNGGNAFYYNVVLNSQVNGIDFRGASTVNPGLIYNNTVIHHPLPAGNAGHGVVVQVAGAKANIYNNLVTCDVAGSDVQCLSLAGPYTTININNNLYYATNGAHVAALDLTNYDSLSSFQSAMSGKATIVGKDSSSISSNPYLCSTYLPTLSSPGIGAGTNVAITGVVSLTDRNSNPVTDSSGNAYSRYVLGVQKDSVDIGAYQVFDALSINASGHAVGGFFNAGNPYTVSLPDSLSGYSVVLSGGVVNLTTPLKSDWIKIRLTDGAGAIFDSSIPVDIVKGKGFSW